MDLVTAPARFEVWLVNLDDDEADAVATVLAAMSARGRGTRVERPRLAGHSVSAA